MHYSLIIKEKEKEDQNQKEFADTKIEMPLRLMWCESCAAPKSSGFT